MLLHQYYISPFCEKIRRQLHWKGIAYETKDYPLMARKAVMKLSSAGKLPCLEHKGKIIADSTDICYYIEKQFPNKPMIPQTKQAHGMMHVLEDWADESLYFYEMYCRFYIGKNSERNIPRMLHADNPLVQKFMPRLIRGGLGKLLHAQGLSRKTQKHVLGDLRRHLEALEHMLSGSNWLVGENITLADLSVYTMVGAIADGVEGMGIVKKHPNVLRWMERVEKDTGGPTKGARKR
jgi:glutathione S-transferase